LRGANSKRASSKKRSLTLSFYGNQTVFFPAFLGIRGGFPFFGKAFRAIPVPANAGRGNRVLENELFQSAGFKDHRVFVKRMHMTGKLLAVEQMHGDVFVPQQRCMKKRFLNAADRHG
jgi:hypothetical protein